MYTIYVKFECLPQKRDAFIAKVKEGNIEDAYQIISETSSLPAV